MFDGEMFGDQTFNEKAFEKEVLDGLAEGNASDSFRRGKRFKHFAIGTGYADFVLDDGSEGDNRYWTAAFLDRKGQPQGFWAADVYIDFGGFVFDFEVIYTVDCLEIDRTTREAWIEGVVIRANDPEFLGRRAFLYVKDGGPRGEDLHAITPLNDPEVTCADRPEPDFREAVERGNYIVR